MGGFEVEFFELDDGSYPAEEFILMQAVGMRAKIYRMLSLLEEKGNDLQEPYSGPLGDGIFELRTKLATDITRILYFFTAGQKIILTNGFVKKSQRTPPREIAKAKRYRSMYQEREGGAR